MIQKSRDKGEVEIFPETWGLSNGTFQLFGLFMLAPKKWGGNFPMEKLFYSFPKHV